MMGARQKPVVDEEILLDGQFRIAPLEVPGGVIDHSVAQCQVLVRSGGARIGSACTNPSLPIALARVVGLNRERAIA